MEREISPEDLLNKISKRFAEIKRLEAFLGLSINESMSVDKVINKEDYKDLIHLFSEEIKMVGLVDLYCEYFGDDNGKREFRESYYEKLEKDKNHLVDIITNALETGDYWFNKLKEKYQTPNPLIKLYQYFFPSKK